MLENGVIDWQCGESAVGSTDLYMVFGVSELGLCVSELGSEGLWLFSCGLYA